MKEVYIIEEGGPQYYITETELFYGGEPVQISNATYEKWKNIQDKYEKVQQEIKEELQNVK